MMGFSGWEFATVFSKLVIYLGISSAVGGIFIALMAASHRSLVINIGKYCKFLISIAIVATATNFFIQVGAFAENGLAGMFDTMFIEMLWQSNAGDFSLLTTIGLGLVLISSILISSNTAALRYLAAGFCMISILVLTKSFTLIGHTAEMGFTTQILLGTHLTVAAWWMGALWPFWRACHDVPNDSLYKLMETFGSYAAISVLVLIVCGSLLGFNLVGSFEVLFFTDYGQGIAAKLLIVSLLLLLAAYHKWKLVPALLKKKSSSVLARSIVIEMYLGVFVLGITTFVTTLVGPVH